MKVSYAWLQDYIEEKLPQVEDIVKAFTMHAFEVEGVETHGGDSVIDVKILPDRAHYALSHYGIASEISVIMGKTLKPRKSILLPDISKELQVSIEDTKLCRRYIGAIVKNVKVGPSPEWLVKRLEAVGQRSINNVVDATNYVMLSMGQPLHAFDAQKLSSKHISVTTLKADEKVTLLDGAEHTLKSGMSVIQNEGTTLAVAGVKGGAHALVDASTTELVLESANFYPVTVSKTSRTLGLINDSSKRFANEITPEFAEEGMSLLIALITEIAGGKVEGCVDIYPKKAKHYKVGVSLREINGVLGSTIFAKEVEAIINKFGWAHGCVTPHSSIPDEAKKLLGKPYVWGASVLYDAPISFDCSSLTSYLYKEAGVQIPRVVVDQYVYATQITKEECVAGDLVFSKTTRRDNKPHTATVDFLKGTQVNNGVSHVGVYVGDGKIVHASDPEGVIEEDLATSSRFQDIVGYGRMCEVNERRWWVEVPHDRIDIRIKEDLIEEIGRIYGYEKISAKTPSSLELKALSTTYYWAEKVRASLVAQGFSEVYTYTFRNEGEVEVENPLAQDKKFVRPHLTPGVQESLEFNLRNADLLGLEQIKIFEIGKTFNNGREHNTLSMAIGSVKGFKGIKNNEAIKEAREKLIADLNLPITVACTIDDTGGLLLVNNKQIGVINKMEGMLEVDFDMLVAALPAPTESLPLVDVSKVMYKTVSLYPCMLRDIAVWVPGETGREEEVLDVVRSHSGNLLVGARLFDTFTKKKEGEDTRTSYAYHLVFQSEEKTLTDEEINVIMTKVTETLNGNEGWAVR